VIGGQFNAATNCQDRWLFHTINIQY